MHDMKEDMRQPVEARVSEVFIVLFVKPDKRC